MRKIYNKLVRDNIIDIILEDNEVPNYRILNDNDFIIALKEKFIEESEEIVEAKTKDDVINELADILELVDSLSEQYNISEEELKNKKEDKKIKRGGFNKKIFLEYSDTK